MPTSMSGVIVPSAMPRPRISLIASFWFFSRRGWTTSMWVGVALAGVAFLYVLIRGPRDDSISTEAFDAGVVASDDTSEPVLVGAD